MKLAVGCAVSIAFLPALAGADPPSRPTTEQERYSYSVGFQVGTDFRREGLAMDADFLLRGTQDALAAREPAMSSEEMLNALIAVKQRMMVSEQKRTEEKRELFRREGAEFLARNGKQAGVVTTGSGLQYKVLEEGSGKQPRPSDTVTIHYRGTLVDGAEFDSSQRRGQPASFKLEGVIAGWKEALPLMKEGSRWQVVVPPELAYGERGPLAHRTLVFEIRLLSVAQSAN